MKNFEMKKHNYQEKSKNMKSIDKQHEYQHYIQAKVINMNTLKVKKY